MSIITALIMSEEVTEVALVVFSLQRFPLESYSFSEFTKRVQFLSRLAGKIASMVYLCTQRCTETLPSNVLTDIYVVMEKKSIKLWPELRVELSLEL